MSQVHSRTHTGYRLHLIYLNCIYIFKIICEGASSFSATDLDCYDSTAPTSLTSCSSPKLIHTDRCVCTAANDFGSNNWWWGKGDPQFHGLDGRTFYFDGVPGKIFNIITEQDHQLNALFSAGPHKIE